VKKIGILTFHRTNNFGSQLQAFALYRAIQKLEYDCEIIDYRCPSIENREFKNTLIRINSLKNLIKAVLLNPALKGKEKEMRKFLVQCAELSSPYFPDTITNSNGQYSKFIVGSDIVWGGDITGNDLAYFLNFVSDKTKKFAFSSSVGDSEKGAFDPQIVGLLSDFSKICVRENSAAEWVKVLSGREADVVCDPTMLISAEEWVKHIKPRKYRKGYVLVYFNNDDGKCMDDAVRYANDHGLKVYHISYNMPVKGVKRVRPKKIGDFLGLIRNADAVFTASYHGMLFSTYFEKELYFYTRSHKERMLSLAEKISITGRCCDECDIYDVEQMDYTDIKNKISAFRNTSISFLKTELET